MKYVTLVIYLFSFTPGFVNLGFQWLAWHRTKDRSFLLFLLFLVFFTAKLVVFNAEFFLESLLGWEPIRGTLTNLTLASASSLGFNVFLVLFVRSVSRNWKRSWDPLWFLVASNPAVVLMLSPWLGPLTGLAAETVADSGLLAFLTWHAWTSRKNATSPYFGAVLTLTAVLNMVYFPLAVFKAWSDSWYHYDPGWFQLGNGYYLVGNLGLVVLVAQHHLLRVAPAPQGAHPLDQLQLERFGISAREAEVVGLLGEGKTNREIGLALHISPGTVKNHLYKVYQKTGVQTRVELLNLLRIAPM